MREFKANNLTKLIAALSLALPLAAAAQDRETTTPSNAAQRPASQSNTGASDTTKPSHSDTEFLKEAAMGGMLEVELGRVAVQNAASDQVKRFGQRMVDDHGKANDALKSLAQAEGVTLPTQLDSKHEKEMQRLQKLTGAEFDREYMKMMVSDHRKDIREFEHEARRGEDPEVKAFAEKALPTLREHLNMAEQTHSSVSGEGRSTTEPTGATERPTPKQQ